MNRLHDLAEEACLNAWPAIHTLHYDGWLLRFGGGETRRINSVNVLHEGRLDLAAKIAHAEAAFRAHGLPPCFRIRSTDDPALDRALATRDYGLEGETCTVLMPSIAEALDLAATPPIDVEFTARPTNAWRAAHARFLGTPAAAIALRHRILGLIAIPTLYAACRNGAGAIVSAAYGAAHDRMISLQWVATDPALRQRGLAQRTLTALLTRAARDGLATAATLQVEADNDAALRLYRGLGFTADINRYHYRCDAA
ncbi:Mycothiol acetyltransferase [Alphaproteobacteria bacterium SO-S41]|nr:Mycothiol acetyltransferase [Alphaproteobacteria bacterium SO-S41]